jgi:hypothetical protein
MFLVTSDMALAMFQRLTPRPRPSLASPMYSEITADQEQTVVNAVAEFLAARQKHDKSVFV